MKNRISVESVKLKCTCCGKQIKSLYPKQQSDTPAEFGMYNRSIVGNISGNYGSAFDGDIFLIAICDSCMSFAIKDQRVLHVQNYLEEFLPIIESQH